MIGKRQWKKKIIRSIHLFCHYTTIITCYGAEAKKCIYAFAAMDFIPSIYKPN